MPLITYPELSDQILRHLLQSPTELSLGHLSETLKEDTELLHAVIIQIEDHDERWIQTNFRQYFGGVSGLVRANPAYRSAIKLFLESGGFAKANQVEIDQNQKREQITKLEFEKLESEVWELRNKPDKDKTARNLAIIAIVASVVVPIVIEIIK